MTPEDMLKYGKSLGLWREAKLVGAKPKINQYEGYVPFDSSLSGAPQGSQYERQRDERLRESEKAWNELQKKQAESDIDRWKPVKADFPVLIYDTEVEGQIRGKMDDKCAPDMLYDDESRETIEQYGLNHPFKPDEYTIFGHVVYGEDEFSLSKEEHFKRMRGLGTIFSFYGDTRHLYGEMVDQFAAEKGGHYSNPLLDDALREHETTQKFHQTLMAFLKKYLKQNQYALTSDIVPESLAKSGSTRPMFPAMGRDLIEGTTLTVHDIWAMKVYAKKLEYKGDQIRGILYYEIQDHFGLDANDINHQKILKFEDFKRAVEDSVDSVTTSLESLKLSAELTSYISISLVNALNSAYALKNILKSLTSWDDLKNALDLIKNLVVSLDALKASITSSFGSYHDSLASINDALNSLDKIKDSFIKSSKDSLSSMMKAFELMAGFRSWYLLQHYVGYGIEPLFTDIRFELEATSA